MRVFHSFFLFFLIISVLIPFAADSKSIPVYDAGSTGTFFHDWLLCGPFPNSSERNLTDYKHGKRCTSFIDDLLTETGGEAKAEPKVGDTVSFGEPSVKRAWFLHQSKSDLVKLNDLLTPNDNVVAYAYCTIESPNERQAIAAIGSNDNVKCWLNGELVHTFAIPDGRWLQADDDYVPIRLRKGRNRLLLKVCEGTGDFGLAFRLLDYRETVQSILNDIKKHSTLSAVTKEDELQMTFGTPHRLEAVSPGAKVRFEIIHRDRGLIASIDGREGFVLTYPLSSIPDGFFSVQASFPLHDGKKAVNEVEHFKGRLPRHGLPKRLGNDLAMRDKNGKPFFPIGTYGASPENYPLLRESGYTFVTGGTSSLDAAQKAGIKVGVSMHGSGDEWLDHIRETVREHKNHPALLFWMLFDEPGYNKANLLQMHEAYQLIHREDPVHPVYLVITDPTVYETFGRCCDVLAVDTYPISQGAIQSIGDNILKAYADSDGDLPVWHCGQLFKWPGDRFPTIKEHRFMSYQAIQSGAKAMLWYSFRYQGPILPEAVPDLWEAQLQLLREIHQLEPVLVYPGLGERLGTGHSAIRAIAKRGPDRTLTVIAVNTSQTETIDSRIQCPVQLSERIPVQFESRNVMIENGLIQDRFKPLDVHIYQIKEE